MTSWRPWSRRSSPPTDPTPPTPTDPVEAIADRWRSLDDDADYDERDRIADEAWKAHPDHPTVISFHAISMTRAGQATEARALIEQSLNRFGDHPDLYRALRRAVRTAPTWQQRDVLRRGRVVLEDDPDWIRYTAETASAQGDHAEARAYYERLARRFPRRTIAAYKTAREARLEGDLVAARHWFDEAVTRDANAKRSLGAAELGVGVIARRVGDWDEAIEELQARIDAGGPNLREIQLEIARIRLDQHRWRDAESAARVAAGADPDPASLAILGRALEGLRRWQEAADAHEAAADDEGLYRAVYALVQDHDWGRAARLLRDRLRTDAEGRAPASDDPALPSTLTFGAWFALADRSRAAGDPAGAARAGRAGLDRLPDHDPAAYRQLALDLLASGQDREAALAFIDTRVHADPPGLVEEPTEVTPEFWATRFAEYRERLPMRTDTIVYESFHGASIGCNPLALYEQIRTDPRFAGALHVWGVGPDATIPDGWAAREDVALVPLDSDAYLRHLATAGLLINNSTFPPYFVRRPEQKYVNTWHGTPLKAMGRHNRTEPFSHANTARNFLQATHLTFPNAHTRDTMLDSSAVAGLVSGRAEVTGSPRLDRVVAPHADRVRRTRLALGIDDDRPLILYTPTWQGTWQERDHSTRTAREVLEALGGIDAHVRYRGHHFVEQDLALADLPAGTVAPRDLETYDLLAASTVLVTDYSSLLFDAAVTGRPTVLHVPDLDAYRTDRGFSIDPQDLSLPLTTTVNDLTRIVSALVAETTVDPAFVERFGSREDGRAAARVVDLLFDDSPVEPQDLRPTVVLRASFIPNGVTSSLLNLTSTLPTGVVHPVVIGEARPLMAEHGRREEALRLAEGVDLLLRVGPAVLTLREQGALRCLQSRRGLGSSDQWRDLAHGMSREAQRILGPRPPAAIVEFDGYSPWWTALCAATPAERRVTYLHNDMLSEWRTRSRALAQIFSLYGRGFDALVSVSAPLADLNRENLAAHFGVPEHLHTYCDNQIDLPGILARAAEPLPPRFAGLFDAERTVFATVGRLSIEKNHRLMLEAFAATHAARPDTHLVIVGDGYLAAELPVLTAELGIADAVTFTGQLSNPLPLVARADCFVMSSLHEGQPMAIWEAMTLGRPVISTDLPGVRDMLAPDLGTLVGTDPAELAAAMIAAADGAMPPQSFDATDHVARCRDRFLQIVGLPPG